MRVGGKKTERRGRRGEGIWGWEVREKGRIGAEDDWREEERKQKICGEK